jgi:hypothetical protein
VEADGGSGEASLFDDGDEGFELGEIHNEYGAGQGREAQS